MFLISSLKIYLNKIFQKKIKLEDVIDYIENKLKIQLDHKSVNSNSRYYEIGEVYLRISDHFCQKSKDTIGIAVVDDGAFIHLFNKIITVTSFKELKFFLWSFLNFYTNDQINGIFQNTLNELKKEISEKNRKINRLESKIKNQKEELSKLNLISDKNKKEIQNLKNQVVTLHKKNLYLDKVTSVKKKSPSLASVRNKQKISEAACEDLMELIYKVSEYLDKLPEKLQGEILNYIGNYYDQK